MRPLDFWRMHPVEFWWQYEARRPPKTFPSMTEEEAEECLDLLLHGDPK